MAIKAKLLPRWPADVSATAPIVATKANGAVALSYNSSTLPQVSSPTAAGRVVVREGTVYNEVPALNIAFPTIANNNLIGNVSGSTAAPAAVTGAQANAILPTFTGDTGAGGVKGLVPAPAAGDAAAGRYLKADGTFAVPSGAVSSVAGRTGAVTLDGTDVSYTKTGTGTVQRTANSKMSDLVACLSDFGTLSTSVAATNDAIVNLAEASNFTYISIPEGRWPTTKTEYQVTNKTYVGPGQLIMNGYAQAPNRSFITSVQTIPSTNRLRLFDSGFPKAYRKSYAFVNSGANPAVLPSTYTNYTEWAQDVIVHDFTAGFNKDAADHALGRSGAFVAQKFAYHGGQGDLTIDSYYMEIYSTRAGATHFLSCPAGAFHNGSSGASGSSTGAYLQGSEYLFSDNGIAVACIGDVRNYIRTNASETLYQKWIHNRGQSGGSQPLNSFYSMAGPSLVGLDATPADFGTNKVAIALKQNDRIYWGASANVDPLGTKWYADIIGSTFSYYDGSNLNHIVGGVAGILQGSAQITATIPLVFQPGAAAPTLGINGYATFEFTSNTSFKIKARGTDGVTRSVTLTLA